MKMQATATLRGKIPLTRVAKGKPAMRPRLSRSDSHDGDMPISFFGGDILDPAKLGWPEAVVDYLTGRELLIPYGDETPDDNEAAEDLQGSIVSGTRIASGLADGDENTASAESVAGAGSGVAKNDKEASFLD